MTQEFCKPFAQLYRNALLNSLPARLLDCRNTALTFFLAGCGLGFAFSGDADRLVIDSEIDILREPVDQAPRFGQGGSGLSLSGNFAHQRGDPRRGELCVLP